MPKPNTKIENLPLAVKLLLKQISEGLIPSKEELNEYFQDIDVKYYRNVAIALLPSAEAPRAKRLNQTKQKDQDPDVRTGVNKKTLKFNSPEELAAWKIVQANKAKGSGTDGALTPGDLDSQIQTYEQ